LGKILYLIPGRAKICLHDKEDPQTPSNCLEVTVIKEKDSTDVLFNISVTLVVMIVYISFGAQLDWSHIKEILRRPVGPLVGILNQMLFLPIIAFLIGHALFQECPELSIGLFFTGVCPSGGFLHTYVFL
jgi:predicted Na+-dependent transporter